MSVSTQPDFGTNFSGIFLVSYGLLYNFYAATDPRNITAAGWHVPSDTEFWTLVKYLDPAAIWGNNTAGGQVKEVGVYWNTPNIDATNSSGFNGRGAGLRESTGAFTDFKVRLFLWNSNEYGPTGGEYSSCTRLTGILTTSGGGGWIGNPKIWGMSVRPIRDSTILTHGQIGSYTGNDGKIYRTICIGTQEWLADNLCETLYRDGSPIPEVTDNAAWAALSTGALCVFNNDWSYI